MESNDNDSGKLQKLLEKWGTTVTVLLFTLSIFVYKQDKATLETAIANVASQAQMDQKGLSTQINSNTRAISRLQEAKASREELKTAIESVSKDNAIFRQDVKDSINTLRNDLVQRMDILVNSSKK